MRPFVIWTIVILMISCLTGSQSAPPQKLASGVSDIKMAKGSSSRYKEGLIGDFKITRKDRDFTAAYEITDQKNGVRSDFPQYGRFH